MNCRVLRVNQHYDIATDDSKHVVIKIFLDTTAFKVGFYFRSEILAVRFRGTSVLVVVTY